MIYNFNGNYINLMDVSHLVCRKSDNTSFPWELTVHLKTNGNTLGVIYKTQKARDDEAKYIANAINNCFYRMNTESLSRDDVKSIVSKDTDKIRRDIRVLKSMLTMKGD